MVIEGREGQMAVEERVVERTRAIEGTKSFRGGQSAIERREGRRGDRGP